MGLRLDSLSVGYALHLQHQRLFILTPRVLRRPELCCAAIGVGVVRGLTQHLQTGVGGHHGLADQLSHR